MKDFQWVGIDTLKPNPKNPNKHSPEQIERLIRLIEYQGWRHPIIVSNQSGLVVVGHGRLEAAKQMRLEKVPVHHQDFDSTEQEYAFLVSDNAIASWAELDLPQITIDIPKNDFDIDLLGIKDFALGLVNEINSGDENSEWMNGMPDFQEGKAYINLILQFQNESDRDAYVRQNQITIHRKRNNQWIVLK